MENTMKKLMNEVKRVAGEGFTVEETISHKNNGIDRLGILIHKKEDAFGPLVYVDQLLPFIAKGQTSLEEAAKRIFEMYRKQLPTCEKIDVSELTRKDYLLGNTEIHLVNAERNKEMLSECPHRLVEDLAVTYRTRIRYQDGQDGSFVVTNQILEKARLRVKELEVAAVRNTEKAGFLTERILPGLYVLTNKEKVYGANIFLFPAEIASLAEKLQSDLFIIPSSVHELLAVRTDGLEPEKVKKMIRDMNSTQIDPEEILSYSLYRFDRQSKTIRIVL